MLFHSFSNCQLPTRVHGGRGVEVGHARRGGRRRTVEHHLHHPFAPFNGACTGRMRGQGEDAGMTQQSPSLVVGILHPPEVAASHVRHAVVPGQPSIDEGVIGRVQLEHTAIFSHQIVEEEFCFAPHRGSELLVEVGILPNVRLHLVEVLQSQPLRGKAGGEGRGPRVSHHALHLALQYRGLRQRTARCNRQQLPIGGRRPEEERKARREVEVANLVARARLDLRWRTLEAEDEVGAGQHSFQGSANARLESAHALRSTVVQRHQTAQIMGSEGAAIRLRSESHDDRLGAGTGRCAGGGPAGEDFPPNRRLRHAGRTKGPVDHHVAQMR